MTENVGRSVKINIGMISIGLLLIINMTVAAFGYGQMSQQVKFNREMIQSYQGNQVSIMMKLDDQSRRLTTLEVKLETLLTK